ncbi:hypothetical protein ANRL3_02791 [Anaerolineae bacterium]|nr:hypothetical protein ANRL3_02791 [Anaerolineae bacterium]
MGLRQELRKDVAPSDAIAHLHMEGEGVVQLGIASAAARFERFQPDWHINRHVGPPGKPTIFQGSQIITLPQHRSIRDSAELRFGLLADDL